MAFIISSSLTVSIILLACWSFFESYERISKILGKLFYLSFGVYLISLISSFFSFGLTSLFYPFRDMLWICGVSAAFLIIKNFKIKSWIPLGILAIASMMIFQRTYESYDLAFAQNVESSAKANSSSCTTSSATANSIAMTSVNLKKQANDDLAEVELLVELYKKADLGRLKSLMSNFDVEIKSAFNPARADITDLDDYYTIDIKNNDPKTISMVTEILQLNNFIEWVEPNETYKIDDQISDIKFDLKKKKSSYNDPMLSQQWAAKALDFEGYNSYLIDNKLKPKKVAKLYILDTGVDGSHEDLKANYRSLKSKYDKDKIGHGTHCAGIAAAVTNNKTGIASIAPNDKFVNVTSITVLGSFGGGTQKSIIDGMIEAIDNGADVISMSLGGKSTQIRQKAYNEVSKYALDHNVIIVAAAGNSNADAAKYSPANTKDIICVSALDQDLKKASFSNYTDNVKYALAAPGKDILSTLPENKYKAMSGTSMATPYVAGTNAVLRSIKPELTIFEAFELLNNSGMQTMNQSSTGTLINPKGALEQL